MIKYVVIPVAEVTYTHLNASTSHLLEQARLSVDGALAVLKFDETVSGTYFIDRQWYSRGEIDLLMEDSAWVISV